MPMKCLGQAWRTVGPLPHRLLFYVHVHLPIFTSVVLQVLLGHHISQVMQTHHRPCLSRRVPTPTPAL